MAKGARTESRRRRRGASKHSSAVIETISARTKTWVGLWAAAAAVGGGDGGGGGSVGGP